MKYGNASIFEFLLTMHHKNADADFDNTTGKMNGERYTIKTLPFNTLAL